MRFGVFGMGRVLGATVEPTRCIGKTESALRNSDCKLLILNELNVQVNVRDGVTGQALHP